MRRSPARRDSPEASGYTLVGLVVLLMVAQVLVAVALPSWTQSVKREKEEELIFRGLQYAEAIRVFQTRFNRFPVTLDELIDTNPRCIRRLWKDPMTEDGEWGLVFAQGVSPRPGGRPGEEGDDEEDEEGIDEGGRELGGGSGLRPLTRRGQERQRQAGTLGGPGGTTRGPISGVFSKSDERAIKRFEGGSSYKEWKFVVSLLPTDPLMVGDSLPSLNSRWVGRPFPEGIEPEEGAGPGELVPGSRQPAAGDGEPTKRSKREERRRKRREQRRRPGG